MSPPHGRRDRLLGRGFLFYDEDTDLNFRAQLAGWKCSYVPTASPCVILGPNIRYPNLKALVFMINRGIFYEPLATHEKINGGRHHSRLAYSTRGGEKCLEVFCGLFPRADVYTLIYAPDRVSSLVKSMNVRASRLNDIPRINRVYRYCLPLFPRLIESFDLRDYDLIVSSSHCVAKGSFRTGRSHFVRPCPYAYVWDMHDAYFGRGGSLLARVGCSSGAAISNGGTLQLRSGWITSWQTLEMSPLRSKSSMGATPRLSTLRSI